MGCFFTKPKEEEKVTVSRASIALPKNGFISNQTMIYSMLKKLSSSFIDGSSVIQQSDNRTVSLDLTNDMKNFFKKALLEYSLGVYRIFINIDNNFGDTSKDTVVTVVISENTNIIDMKNYEKEMNTPTDLSKTIVLQHKSNNSFNQSIFREGFNWEGLYRSDEKTYRIKLTSFTT